MQVTVLVDIRMGKNAVSFEQKLEHFLLIEIITNLRIAE